MAWLYDVKDKKTGNRSGNDPNDWGYLCGFCLNTFQSDEQQLADHQNSPKHTMCKGVNDKFNKDLAIERGVYITPQERKERLKEVVKPDPEFDEVILSRKRKIARLREQNANQV